MAIKLIRTQPLKRFVTVIFLLLLLLVFCSVCGGRAAAVHLHVNCNSSLSQSLAISEWSLESEHGRRLLQTPKYLTYPALDGNRAAGQTNKAGNSYSRGCQRTYYCRG